MQNDEPTEGNRPASISGGRTLREIGAFWDEHDFTEFDTDAPDIEAEVVCSVPVEPTLFAAVAELARRRGISAETLVNLWLQQKLDEHNSGA
jgi:hypothetical protein